MGKSPAFQFYPSDFLSDANVLAMTDAQLGIYIRLIGICWQEGSIPGDLEALKRIATKRPDEFEEDWKWIAPCFMPGASPGIAGHSRLVHPRLEKEREKQKKFNTAQSKRAKNGWATKLQRNARGMPDECPNDAFQSSSSSSNITYPSGKASAPHPIWQDGVSLLVSVGDTEANSRAFLGRALKLYGEGALDEAISACILEQPVNPRAWIMGALKARKGGPGKPKSRMEVVQANDRVAGSGRF